MPCEVCEHMGARGGDHSRDDDCLLGEKQRAIWEQRKARGHAGSPQPATATAQPGNTPEGVKSGSGEAEGRAEP